jgi:stearoyl-CoA desaturase (delta-9 desaturase)
MGSKRIGIREYATSGGAFIAAYHVGLAIGLPLYFFFNTPGVGLVVASIVLLFLTEIGIGAAYHRFYSHRAFTLSKPAEAVLLFLSTLALQGSVLRWSFDHRLHHAHVDTDDDPYSIKKGFWYAHVMWLFDPARPIDERLVADLTRNRLVMLQHRYYRTCGIGFNILVWLALGWLFGDFLGAFFLVWWTRLLFSHHLTCFVNSLAHYWGSPTYSREHSAVDNFILAFLTVGEGYHNYHHTFASDYRNGVRWYHFDPVKWTVFSLSKLGLADNLRRYSSSTIRRRLLVEDRRFFLARLEQLGASAMPELERHVRELAARIQDKVERMGVVAGEIRQLKRERTRQALESARAELRALKHGLRHDWKSWKRLGALIPEPAAA